MWANIPLLPMGANKESSEWKQVAGKLQEDLDRSHERELELQLEVANLRYSLNVASTKEKVHTAHLLRVKEALVQCSTCPISQELLRSPVLASDGHTYEKRCIEKWRKTQANSPLNREELDDFFVVNRMACDIMSLLVKEFKQDVKEEEPEDLDEEPVPSPARSAQVTSHDRSFAELVDAVGDGQAVRVAQILSERPYHTNSTITTSDDELSLLQYALVLDHQQVALEIVQHCPLWTVEHYSREGLAALHIAAVKNMDLVCQAIMDKFPEVAALRTTGSLRVARADGRVVLLPPNLTALDIARLLLLTPLVHILSGRRQPAAASSQPISHPFWRPYVYHGGAQVHFV